MDALIQILVLAVGFAMLVKGADWFVDGSSKIADRFGIPQLVIGLTIVAMGTSAPETAVSVSSALKGNAEFAIGNILGSNILNILIILGITSVICTVPVQKSTVRYETPFMILITILLGLLGLTDGVVGRLDGVILLLFMVVYLLYLLKMAKNGQAMAEELPELSEKDTIPRLLLSIVVGMGLIVWGSNLAVDSASALAAMFGMSERLVGLTIVALGTSLPELVTSVTAAIKHKADIAVGNIVGSNIYNALFVIGVASLITPVSYQPNFLVDTIVAVGAALVLLFCVLRTRKLTRIGGIVMLLCYAGYFVYLIQ